jgi:hypothetical protein
MWAKEATSEKRAKWWRRGAVSCRRIASPCKCVSASPASPNSLHPLFPPPPSPHYISPTPLPSPTSHSLPTTTHTGPHSLGPSQPQLSTTTTTAAH